MILCERNNYIFSNLRQHNVYVALHLIDCQLIVYEAIHELEITPPVQSQKLLFMFQL